MIYLGDLWGSAPRSLGPTPPVDADEAKQYKKLRDAREKIRDIVNNKRPLKSKDFERHWKDYKYQILTDFETRKCAYCETRFGSGSPGDIEHYRPKTEVHESLNSGTRDDIKGRPNRTTRCVHKPGYWWLAYSWSNWLLACDKCNRAWKKNQFPCVDPRPLSEGCEEHEEPLLLNPLIDDPAPHFSFNALGQIEGKTKKGKTTIDVCGLDRKSLEDERKVIADDLFNHLDDLCQYQSDGYKKGIKNVFRDLIKKSSAQAPFAGMARFLIAEAGIDLARLNPKP